MSLSAPREQECGGKDDEGIRSFSQSSTLAFFLIWQIITILFLREVYRHVHLPQIRRTSTDQRKQYVHFGDPINLLDWLKSIGDSKA